MPGEMKIVISEFDKQTGNEIIYARRTDKTRVQKLVSQPCELSSF